MIRLADGAATTWMNLDGSTANIVVESATLTLRGLHYLTMDGNSRIIFSMKVALRTVFLELRVQAIFLALVSQVISSQI